MTPTRGAHGGEQMGTSQDAQTPPARAGHSTGQKPPQTPGPIITVFVSPRDPHTWSKICNSGNQGLTWKRKQEHLGHRKNSTICAARFETTWAVGTGSLCAERRPGGRPGGAGCVEGVTDCAACHPAVGRSSSESTPKTFKTLQRRECLSRRCREAG